MVLNLPAVVSGASPYQGGVWHRDVEGPGLLAARAPRSRRPPSAPIPACVGDDDLDRDDGSEGRSAVALGIVDGIGDNYDDPGRLEPVAGCT